MFLFFLYTIQSFVSHLMIFWRFLFQWDTPLSCCGDGKFPITVIIHFKSFFPASPQSLYIQLKTVNLPLFILNTVQGFADNSTALALQNIPEPWVLTSLCQIWHNGET